MCPPSFEQSWKVCVVPLSFHQGYSENKTPCCWLDKGLIDPYLQGLRFCSCCTSFTISVLWSSCAQLDIDLFLEIAIKHALVCFIRPLVETKQHCKKYCDGELENECLCKHNLPQILIPRMRTHSSCMETILLAKNALCTNGNIFAISKRSYFQS